MTPEAFGTLAFCLEFLPSGTAPAWNDNAAKFYFAILSGIPDEGVPALMKAVGTHFKFRPTPSEILDVWAKISAPAPRYTPDSLVAALRARVQRHGAYAVPHPDSPNVFLAGPPPDLTPEEARVVAAWGGWAPFCEDDSPMGVRTGHLLRVAESVCRGAADRDIDDLRLEYQEARAQIAIERSNELARLAAEDPHFDPFEDDDPPAPREGGGMARLGELTARQVGR